jgi:hypothetical protein
MWRRFVPTASFLAGAFAATPGAKRDKKLYMTENKQ